MVFRKDRAGDSFQRQISALRQQLGGAEFDEAAEEVIIENPGGVEAAYVSSRAYEQPTQYGASLPTFLCCRCIVWTVAECPGAVYFAASLSRLTL